MYTNVPRDVYNVKQLSYLGYVFGLLSIGNESGRGCWSDLLGQAGQVGLASRGTQFRGFSVSGQNRDSRDA